VKSLTPAVGQSELDAFERGYMYHEAGILVDRLIRIDDENGVIEAELDTSRPLAYSTLQRTTDAHPLHVSAGDLLMATGTLACLYAWLRLGCKWEDGWAGFGSRVHRIDFKHMVQVGPPLEMRLQRTALRRGSKRIMLRCALRFSQEGRLNYVGDQTAMFVRNLSRVGSGAEETFS